MNRRRILLTIALIIGAATLVVSILQREPAADGKPITYWLENFGDYDSDEPNPAAIALKKIGTNALPWMLREIKRENSETKLWFQRQIGRQSLIKFKFKDDDEHRDHAATAFEILGEVAAPAIPELMRLLEAEDVNPEVEQALVHIGSASISPLTNALVSTNASLREHAADTLGEFGPSAASAVPALMNCLTDSDAIVRATVVSALGKIHSSPQQVIPALIKTLYDLEKDVRSNAAYALSRFGRDAEMAIDALLRRIEDRAETANVQNAAISALGCIGCRSELVIPVLLAQWNSNGSARYSIADTLGSFPDKADETLPILFAAAKDRYWWEALNSLSKMKNKAEIVAPFLVSLLKNSEPCIRYHAALALADLGDTSEQTISSLEELQNDDAVFFSGSMGNKTVRQAAESALGTLQPNQTP